MPPDATTNPIPSPAVIGLDLAVAKAIEPRLTQFELHRALMKSKRNQLRFISSLARAKKKLAQEKRAADGEKLPPGVISTKAAQVSLVRSRNAAKASL